MLLESFKQFLPILILLGAIGIVLSRLPRVELGHSDAFLKRRFLNWLPLGLTYSFLYMGRYNLTVSKNALGSLMTNADFGTIFFWGTLVYGFAFVINGPLTDKFGGRAAILVAAGGSALMNLLMGLVIWGGYTSNLVVVFSILYAANMYFQSFGAVAIVKVNAHWFHLKERGVFGGIFGILISLGVYFAFDWGRLIVENAPTYWVFLVPTAMLALFFAVDYLWVKDSPGQAGHKDFDTADGSSHETGPQLGAIAVARRMLANPIILSIAFIEFCTGFLRNAIMHWYIIFAKQTGIMKTFVPQNWGLLLCVTGILGGVFAGVISDRIFHSRRGPMSAVLYGMMFLGSLVAPFVLGQPALGVLVLFMTLAVLGVHGMLSGTASMDFGGKRNVGVAVGLIDGMVYLGTAAQAILYGKILPTGDAAKDPLNWSNWPLAMIPFAALGLFIAMRLWNATPATAREAAARAEKKLGRQPAVLTT